MAITVTAEVDDTIFSHPLPDLQYLQYLEFETCSLAFHRLLRMKTSATETRC